MNSAALILGYLKKQQAIAEADLKLFECRADAHGRKRMSEAQGESLAYSFLARELAEVEQPEVMLALVHNAMQMAPEGDSITRAAYIKSCSDIVSMLLRHRSIKSL